MNDINQYINININNINNLLGYYLRTKHDFDTAYHTYITKKTNIENIMKYNDTSENELIMPYKKFIDNQLSNIKELHTEYNKNKSIIYNLKNEVKSNITILTDLLNEIENNLQNKSNANISDLDTQQINLDDLIDNVVGFEKNEYSSLYDNNFFYWEGPFGVLVPKHIDKIQSIYSNIYLTKEGQLIIKDNQIKESIFVYDKETYLDNFTDNNNGYFIYSDCNK
jgi:hypothetical protein